jgi:hypothetical protein
MLSPGARPSAIQKLSDAELVYLIKSYVPSCISMVNGPAPLPHECGHPVWEVINGMGELREAGHPRGWHWGKMGPALPARRGRPSIGRYHFMDNFIPVLDLLAHDVALRLHSETGQGENGPDTLAQRFAITRNCIPAAGGLSPRQCKKYRWEPRDSVPRIIRDLRGLEVSERSLKQYRRYWRLAQTGDSRPRPDETESLIRAVQFFLQMRPFRPS